MRFRLTLPQNEAFFQRYAGLIPTLTKLGYLAQAVSALTEVGILFALIRGAVADIAPPHIAIAAGIAGAILGTAFIEIGLRKFLPFSARQILNKRYAGLDLVMSLAIFVVCALLLSASGYLSFQGSKDTVATVTPSAKLEATTDIETTVNNHREVIAAAHSRDSAAITDRYTAQVLAADAAHQAGQDARKTRLRGVESRERNTGQSFATEKSRIRQEVADAFAAHAAAVAALHRDQAAEFLQLQGEHTSLEKDLSRERADWLSALKTRNEVAEKKRERNVRAWGGSVAWFTVLALIVLILSITLQEVHRHGAEIEQEAIPTEFFFRESAISAFVNAISERVNVEVFSWIKEFEDDTREPPEPGKPPVLYEYEQKAERRPIGFKTTTTTTEKTTTEKTGEAVAYESRIDAHKYKDCLHCGAKFMPNHRVQKYCTERCRRDAWELRNGRKPYMKKGGKS